MVIDFSFRGRRTGLDCRWSSAPAEPVPFVSHLFASELEAFGYPELLWQLHCIHFPGEQSALRIRVGDEELMGSNLENVIAAPIADVTRQNDAIARAFVGGTSPAMLTLEGVLSEIALTSIPVLLVGECGTGKQMFAHRIHQLSARSSEPLMKISCAGVRPESFASELGLDASQEGEYRHEAGTAFFDEISELDSLCQRNLLYALPDEETKPRRGILMARLISATSRNLDEEMRAGRFRRELYYRINGVCLRLPALRERKEDIPLLSDYFFAKHCTQLGRAHSRLSARALDTFMGYSWPGNIRELENVVKKIVALNDEELALSELMRTPNAIAAVTANVRTRSLKVASKAASREAERELILKALGRTRWNRKRAAQELQISYKSLLYKLKQIGLDEEAN
jgi:two-component system, NtrC family, response regulator AtoC